jgi:hypothetical protein
VRFRVHSWPLGGLVKADFELRDRPDYYINCYGRIPFGCVAAGA